MTDLRIIANLATYPPRGGFLPRVVASIAPQVDQLNLVLNEHTSVPEFLSEYKNIRPIIPDHDTKDAGKFLPACAQSEYVLLIDDDIIYPSDYVAMSIARMRKLGRGRYLGGYHASIYRRPFLRPVSVRSFKSNVRFVMLKSSIARFRKVFPFTDRLPDYMIVDQIGSGTAIMRGSDMPPYEFMKTSQKFVDVRLARWCFEQDITVVGLPRQKGWLRNSVSEGFTFEETIYSDFTRKNVRHVSNEIRKFAFKRCDVGKAINITELD